MKSLTEIAEQLPLVGAGLASTPSVYRRILVNSKLPQELRSLMGSGALSDDAVREYVDCLMGQFQKGVQFEHEAFLATLAIACESLFTDFADEYLSGLADLSLAEIPLAPRVAREILHTRLESLQEPKQIKFLAAMEYLDVPEFTYTNLIFGESFEATPLVYQWANVA